MRFEIDSSIHVFEYLDNDENIQDFKCVNANQFHKLCNILLTDKQLFRFVNSDGIYNISKKRYLAGVEYMKDNLWNRSK